MHTLAKKSTSLLRGIPDITQNHQILGGNIGDSESTFIQDYKNIYVKKKKRLSLARERSWGLDYMR